MKKILFSCLAAATLVLSMSSFKVTKKPPIAYDWFIVNPGVNVIPGTMYRDNQLTYLETSNSTPPDGYCAGSGYSCTVGFSTTNIYLRDHHLLRATGADLEGDERDFQ